MSDLMNEIADLLERVANGQHVAPEEARSIKARLERDVTEPKTQKNGVTPNDQPPAVSDENGHVVQVAEDGTPFLDETAPHAIRRVRAVGIYIRHYHEKKPLADCWLEVNPHTKATTRASMAVMASIELRWMRMTYPMDLHSALEAHRLGMSVLLDKVAEEFDLTTPLKVGVEKELDDKGRVVRETIVYRDVRDNRSFSTAVQHLAMLHGLGPGAERGRGLRPADPEEPEATGELPTTMEEAIALGKPITFIEHPEDITQEEWEADWDAYAKEREKLLPPVEDRC